MLEGYRHAACARHNPVGGWLLAAGDSWLVPGAELLQFGHDIEATATGERVGGELALRSLRRHRQRERVRDAAS
jgi:hypothetical protein